MDEACSTPASQPPPPVKGELPGLPLRLLALFAFLHLTLVAAFLWGDPGRGFAAESALHVYQSLSGTWRDYAYFAPGVSSDYKAAFLLDRAGMGSTLVELIGDNREITLRFDTVIASCMGDARAREIFAQSWAAFLLGARPDSAWVTVVVERLETPGMAAYRAGRRPVWRRIYAGMFDRRARLSSP